MAKQTITVIGTLDREAAWNLQRNLAKNHRERERVRLKSEIRRIESVVSDVNRGAQKAMVLVRKALAELGEEAD